MGSLKASFFYPRIQQIKSSIARCEQIKDMLVSTDYGKLTASWEKLSLLEPTICCAFCSKFNVSDLYSQLCETTKLREFLIGLFSEFYAQLQTNILSSDLLPTLDSAYRCAR